MSAEADSAPDQQVLTQSAPLDVMVVDQWLIFDCPRCSQTIKLDRKDSVHPIECPACSSPFEPLLNREVKLPPRKAPSRVRRRRGPRSSSDGRQGTDLARGESDKSESPSPSSRSRPTASSLPSEGVVKLVLTPSANQPEPEQEPAPPSRLPVRSALDLERRRVESVETNQSQPDESELNAVIEAQSGGKYKRIRVRTRKKRLTEKQRMSRLMTMGGGFAVLVISLALWGASQFYKNEGEGGDADRASASLANAFTDSEPIGSVIGNRLNLLAQIREVESVEDILQLVRRPKQISPAIHAYYEENPLPSRSMTFQAVTGVRGSLPKDFIRYQMILGTVSRPMYIEKTETHGFRLDWESFVGLGEMPWDQFVESRATKTVRMRVYISDDDYYEAPFGDEERYRCLRIEDPTREHRLYAYYRHNQMKFSRLTERIFESASENSLPNQEGGRIEISMVLDIRFPTGAANSYQVEIVEYITDSWLLP